jgi:hypothetical protein
MAAVGVCTIPIVSGFGTGGLLVGSSYAALWQSTIGNVAAGSALAGLLSSSAIGVFSAGAAYGGTSSATGFGSKYIAGLQNKTKEGGYTSTNEDHYDDYLQNQAYHNMMRKTQNFFWKNQKSMRMQLMGFLGKCYYKSGKQSY